MRHAALGGTTTTTTTAISLLLLLLLLIILWGHHHHSYYYAQSTTDANDDALAVLPEDVRAYVIALDPLAQHVRSLVNDAATHLLGGRKPIVWRAVNGSEALTQARLPLYTQLTLASGRHDHMQLGSAPMLGCLLSHVAVWRAATEGGATTVLVLEEDAILDAVSALRLTQLLHDARNESWDVLLLETGHLTVSGATRTVGELGRTWADPKDAMHNRWMGTRGYLLTRRGALLLLTHADELGVQVDALLGMAVLFDGLRMVWSSANIAHPTRWRPSAVQTWDPCLKCLAPIDSRLYVAVCLLCVAGLYYLSQYASSSSSSAFSSASSTTSSLLLWRRWASSYPVAPPASLCANA